MKSGTLRPTVPEAPAAVDTRREDGPEGRTYAAPFARVWDALLDLLRGRRRWELVHADEEMGLLTVACRPYLPRGADDLSIWVGLDENGLTRVDVRSAARTRRSDFGANARRVSWLLDALDGALGTGARVRCGT